MRAIYLVPLLALAPGSVLANPLTRPSIQPASTPLTPASTPQSPSPEETSRPTLPGDLKEGEAQPQFDYPTTTNEARQIEPTTPPPANDPGAAAALASQGWTQTTFWSCENNGGTAVDCGWYTPVYRVSGAARGTGLGGQAAVRAVVVAGLVGALLVPVR